jgi:hypothetical protein
VYKSGRGDEEDVHDYGTGQGQNLGQMERLSQADAEDSGPGDRAWAQTHQVGAA